MYIPIYIYIYVCVCVCVCVAQRQKTKKHKVCLTNFRILLILNHVCVIYISTCNITTNISMSLKLNGFKAI